VTTSPCLRHDPYLRRTPAVQLDLAGPVPLKLEQLITGDRYADALEAALVPVGGGDLVFPIA
jgi:hypothetical protein